MKKIYIEPSFSFVLFEDDIICTSGYVSGNATSSQEEHRDYTTPPVSIG